MVTGRTPIHFTAKDFDTRMLTELIMFCGWLWVFLVITKNLREEDDTFSHENAEGNLHATEIRVLQETKVQVDAPAKKVKRWANYCQTVGSQMPAGKHQQPLVMDKLTVARRQYSTARPGNGAWATPSDLRRVHTTTKSPRGTTHKWCWTRTSFSVLLKASQLSNFMSNMINEVYAPSSSGQSS